MNKKHYRISFFFFLSYIVLALFFHATLTAADSLPDARVLLIYVDGLRSDVLHELAMSGRLPTIKEHFIDNGVNYPHAFAVFPSSTLANNSAIYTGDFLNRSGLKGNKVFDRATLKSFSYLEPFSPLYAADAHRPAGLRRLGVFLAKSFLPLFPAARERFLVARRLDNLLLEDLVAGAGMRYTTTVSPVYSGSFPIRYELDAANVVPPFCFHHADEFSDRINIRYGLDMVIRPDARVMNFWFPATDVFGEDSPRAQFGEGGETILELDGIITSMVAELQRKKLWHKTYLFLFSDHGMAGGKNIVLQHIDLGREFFHRRGGLNLNVRRHDDHYTHRGRPRDQFVFVDNAGGVARVYLPYGAIESGEWLRRNRLHELQQYRVGESKIDLVDRLLSWSMEAQNLFPERVTPRPVDHLLIRLDETRAAVFANGGSEAVIERMAVDNSRFLYRYLPAREIRGLADGKVDYARGSGDDPFGYLEEGLPLEWLEGWHSEREWLERTKSLPYPDAVVAVANQLFWDGRMAAKRQRFSPDMILCAARGWAFHLPGETGGSHGYLHDECMRIPLLVTGPNVKRGIVRNEAVRNVDLVPTILTLLGIQYSEDTFDGKRLPGLLETQGEPSPSDECTVEEIPAMLPSMRVQSAPAGLIAEYERRKKEKTPAFLEPDTRYKGHDLKRATDLHVLAADIASVFNWELLTVTDMVFDVVIPGKRKQPLKNACDSFVNAYDRLPALYPRDRLRELIFALQLRELTLGEIPGILNPDASAFAGRGMLLRATLLLEFTGHLCEDIDRAFWFPFGKEYFPVVANLTHLLTPAQKTIETLSWGMYHYGGKFVWDILYGIEKSHERLMRALPQQYDQGAEK